MAKPPFQKGDIISNYTIDSTFNLGGMGVLYGVKEQEILIKAPFADAEPHLLKQFQEEIDALKRLKHPGIIKIIDSGMHQDIPWYAMAKLSGKSLRHLLKREKKLSATAALRIMCRIVQAMAHAHSQKKALLHLDIKPENICFEGKEPVLLDFGLAQNLYDTSSAMPACGTLQYMPPEQIQGQAGARSDVYALGILLYEMLAGKTPFIASKSKDNRKETLDLILDLQVEAPPIKNVAESVRTVCEKALSKRAELRYADAGEMIGDVKFAFREQLKLEATRMEQAKNFSGAAVLLREAVEYGLPLGELEEFWKFRIGRSLQVSLVGEKELKIAKRALSLQRHPHLTAILEVVEGDLPYLVVEAPTDDSLAKRIALGNLLDYGNCIDLCRAVLSSMESLKQVNLSIDLEERRIFPGTTVRIAGIHRARMEYSEPGAGDFARMIVKSLLGENVNWQDLSDVFRIPLQKASEGESESDVSSLCRELVERWENKEKQLADILHYKKNLLDHQDPTLVYQLAGLSTHSIFEQVRKNARETLEQLFTPGPDDGDWLKFAQEMLGTANLSFTQKITKFFGGLFATPGVELMEAPEIEKQPELPTTETEQERYSREFVDFSKKSAESPEELSQEQIKHLFEKFMAEKQKEATRRITQKIEKERTELLRSLVQKDEIIGDLQKLKEQMQQQLLEQEKTLREKEQFIRDFKKRQLHYGELSILPQETFPVLHAELWDKIRLAKDWYIPASIKLAQLLEKEFCEPDYARDVLQELLAIAPENREISEALAAIYWQNQSWETLIELYESELEQQPEQNRQTQLYGLLAQLHQRSGRIDGAIKYYDLLLAKCENNIVAMRNLQDIYREKQNWEKLVKIQELECRLEEIDQERRVSLYSQMAGILESKLKEYDKAVENYLSLLKIASDHMEAIRGLQRIYQKQKKYREWHDILLKEAEIQNDRERIVQLDLKIACLKEDWLDDSEGAIEFFEKVRLIRPEDLRVIERLKLLYHARENWKEYAALLEKEIPLRKISDHVQKAQRQLMEIYDQKLNHVDNAIKHGKEALQADPNNLEILRHLQKLYDKAENKAPLAEIYYKEGELLAENRKEKKRRVLVYLEAGQIYRELEESSRAIDCFDKVLQIEPNQRNAIKQLITLLQKKKQWNRLIDLYQHASRFSNDAREQETLHSQIAVLWEREFKDSAKALIHYHIAHQLNPENITNLQHLSRILRSQEKWAQALDIMKAEAELVEDKKRLALYFHMGELWQEKLDNPQQAIVYYQKVMGHGFHRPTAKKLVQLLPKVGDWTAMAALLEKDINVTNLKAPELPEKLLRLAEIYRNNLKITTEATRVFMALLKLDPRHEKSLCAMEQLLEEQKDWKSLPAICKQRLQIIEDDEQKFQLNRKIAEIYQERLYHGAQAIWHYEKALELKPQDEQTIKSLQKLYSDWGHFHKLVFVYQKELEIIEDEARRLEIYRALAEIWSDRLFEPRKAIDNVKEIWDKTGNLEAAKSLAELYKNCELWQNLCELLPKLIEQAAREKDTDKELELQVKLGKVYYDKLFELEPAIGALTRALEIAPDHQEAFRELERIYREQNSTTEWIELLQQREILLRDEKEKRNIRLQLGKLWQQLENDDNAIEWYEKTLEIKKDHGDALRALHELYRKNEKWLELARIAEREVELATSAEEKAEFCYLLGDIYQSREKNDKKAKKYFSEAIDSFPTHVDSLIKLGDIVSGEENWEEAARLFNSAIGHINEANLQKADLLIKLADIYRNHLNIEERSQLMYESALSISPEKVTALEPLSEIYFSQERWSELEFILAKLVAQVPKSENERVAQFYYKWGKVALALKDQESAIGHFSSAVELVEHHLPSLLELSALYQKQDAWNKIAEVCRKIYQIKLAEGTALRDMQAIIYNLAVALENAGEIKEGIEIYQKLLEAKDLRKIEIYQALAKLYKEDGELELCLEHWDKMLKEKPEDSEKRQAYICKADIFKELGNNKKALENVEQALTISKDAELLTKAVELCLATDNSKKAKQWNEELAPMVEGEARVENRKLQGDISWQSFKKASDALKAYREALELAPSRLDIMENIAEIHRDRKDWKTLAEDYQNFLDRLPEEAKETKFSISLALGHLFHEKLDNINEAVKSLEKAAIVNPDHVETQIALAELKIQLPDSHAEAREGHLSLLRHDPLRMASYQALYRICGKSDLGLLAYRTLDLLDPDNLAENLWGDKIGPQKPKKLNTQIASRYIVPVPVRHFFDIMAYSGEWQKKTYSQSYEQSYGVKKKDHLGIQAEPPNVWHIASEIMEILEISEIRMYLVPEQQPKILLENTQPPSLFISEGMVSSYSKDQLQWVLAHHLFYIAQRQVLAVRLSPVELQNYFNALIAIFTGQELSDEQKNLQKKIRSAIPRKIYTVLEERKDLWNKADAGQTQQYLKWLHYCADAQALLLSDSINLSVDMSQRMAQLRRGQSISRTITREQMENEEVKELLTFHISKAHLKLREECGLKQ